MPHSSVLPPKGTRARRLLLAELLGGLLLGVLAGWSAGLVQVRQP